MINELAITDDIFQISNQAYLEKHHRIYGFLTTFSIIGLSEFVEKLKIDSTFQPPVKAVFWNFIGQTKGVEQLGLIVFFTLQEFLLRYKKSETFTWIICPVFELCNSYNGEHS